MSLNKKIDHALEVISCSLSAYKKIAVFASFGKDSVVTLDLCRRINPKIQVISVMTPYKFQETLTYKSYLTDLWNLNIDTYESPHLGLDLYRKDINKCCNYYKVEPTKEAISDYELEAWISGLRNTEGGEMRRFTKEVEVKEDGLVKINPILTFTEKDIWMYHALRNIPIHPLYLQGYRSLGCAPCSAPGSDDEPERATRWGGEKLECGIHTQDLKGKY